MAQGLVRYRCFLPDLTGFTAPPCTGPNYQQSTSQRFGGYESQALRTDYRILASPSGGEGGIRTPGTLIRGTHDFQSCTFNRSVTSPTWKIKYLVSLPCSTNRQCVQNVSLTVSRTYHRNFYCQRRNMTSLKMHDRGSCSYFEPCKLENFFISVSKLCPPTRR